jgi:hypothetical protein
MMRGPLDRLARLDPTRLVGPRAVDVARRLPGVTAGERVVQRLEDAVLRELGRRLDEAGARPELSAGEPGGPGGPRPSPSRPSRPSRTPGTPGTPNDAPEPSPTQLMDSLLRRSIDQDPAAGERSLVDLMIRELVPDEARMLAALSDGSAFPVIDVVARGGGESGRVLLGNASSLGRQAGVVLPERVPVYLTHMLALGLAQRGGEDPKLREEYEILLTEPAVMKARAHPPAGLRRPRTVRATVRISDLGRSVWTASRGE